MDLAWTAPADGGSSPVLGYRIYRNGLAIATVGNVTFYTDLTAEAATTYGYSAAAINDAGEGSRSNTIDVTTP